MPNGQPGSRPDFICLPSSTLRKIAMKITAEVLKNFGLNSDALGQIENLKVKYVAKILSRLELEMALIQLVIMYSIQHLTLAQQKEVVKKVLSLIESQNRSLIAKDFITSAARLRPARNNLNLWSTLSRSRKWLMKLLTGTNVNQEALVLFPFTSPAKKA